MKTNKWCKWEEFKKTTVVSVLDAVFTFFKFKIVSVFSLSIVQTIEQPLQHK